MLVEVAYARPDKQVLLSVSVPIGTTLIAAVELSGIRSEFEAREPLIYSERSRL